MMAPPAPAATYRAATATAAPYHSGAANRCPLCAGTAFFVGRITAECGACGNPLPLAPARAVLPSGDGEGWW